MYRAWRPLALICCVNGGQCGHMHSEHLVIPGLGHLGVRGEWLTTSQMERSCETLGGRIEERRSVNFNTQRRQNLGPRVDVEFAEEFIGNGFPPRTSSPS